MKLSFVTTAKTFLLLLLTSPAASVDMADFINGGELLESFPALELVAAGVAESLGIIIDLSGINSGEGGDCFETTFELDAYELLFAIYSIEPGVVDAEDLFEMARTYTLCSGVYKIGRIISSSLDTAFPGLQPQLAVLNPNVEIECEGEGEGSCEIQIAQPYTGIMELDTYSAIVALDFEDTERFPTFVPNAQGLVVRGLTFTATETSGDNSAFIGLISINSNSFGDFLIEDCVVKDVPQGRVNTFYASEYDSAFDEEGIGQHIIIRNVEIRDSSFSGTAVGAFIVSEVDEDAENQVVLEVVDSSFFNVEFDFDSDSANPGLFVAGSDGIALRIIENCLDDISTPNTDVESAQNNGNGLDVNGKAIFMVDKEDLELVKKNNCKK